MSRSPASRGRDRQSTAGGGAEEGEGAAASVDGLSPAGVSAGAGAGASRACAAPPRARTAKKTIAGASRRLTGRYSSIRAMVRQGRSRRRAAVGARSEEHTSELQSLAYLVCRLLLEKKKN